MPVGLLIFIFVPRIILYLASISDIRISAVGVTTEHRAEIASTF